MRPRHKKHLEERYENCRSFTVDDPASCKGQWRTVFSSENRPLHLEIGCGKGAFVTGMAAAHPETDFIAMECVKDVIVTAMEKVFQSGLQNIRFILGNANSLGDLFAPGEIDRIYLNFSDPWPKKKQAKHRLTSAVYLPLYQKVLSPDGFVIQKTDNRALFEFSLQSFADNGWSLSQVTYDLHSADTPAQILQENVVTEYERRFLDAGQPIHRLEAYPPRSIKTQSKKGGSPT